MRTNPNDVTVAPATMTPQVSVMSGEPAKHTSHFWVRGRPISGLLPGRTPRKRISLPVSRDEAGVMETLRFLVGVEVVLASYPLIFVFQRAFDALGFSLALLPVVLAEAGRQLVRRGRSVPTVHSAAGEAVVIRGAHPDFVAAIPTAATDQNARSRGPVGQ